jgi:hypothetical protein
MKTLQVVHTHPTDKSGVLEITLEFQDSQDALKRGGGDVTIVKGFFGKNDPEGAVARELRNMADKIDPPAGD